MHNPEAKETLLGLMTHNEDKQNNTQKATNMSTNTDSYKTMAITGAREELVVPISYIDTHIMKSGKKNISS